MILMVQIQQWKSIQELIDILKTLKLFDEANPDIQLEVRL